MADKPLDQLLTQTDPAGCHIVNLPQRIWVFGSICTPDSVPAGSLRDDFLRQALRDFSAPAWAANLDKIENHRGWHEFSGYDDLLEFERDACYLAQASIVFAESPGAFSEIGAFALDNAILPRLAVVVQSKYRTPDEQESFLNLGPFSRVERHGALIVIGATGNTVLPPYDYQEIVRSFSDWLPGTHKRERLKSENPTHRLLIVADLVDLMLVADANDLHAALNHFGVSMSVEALQKALKLLAFLQLIEIHEVGRKKYWRIHGKSNAPWVDYTSKSDQPPFERARFKVSAEKLVQSDSHLRQIYERRT